MIGIIDVVIILIIGMGMVIGFRNGVLRSGVTFFGSILVLAIAFTLKNPLSIILYRYLPFLDFGGKMTGITAINILVYEALSFLIIFTILLAIFEKIVKITGILEKFMNYTIILGIPSKILGAIFGFFQYYIFAFIIIFLFSQFSFSNSLVQESNLATKMMTKTPVLATSVNNAYQSITEIKVVVEGNQTSEFLSNNRKSLEILINRKIISPANAKYLVEHDKLKIQDPQGFLNQY